MNDQEFILLLEEYLEGGLTPERRSALRTEVLSNSLRRQLFDNQARQHIRLHAQSGRIDFSETQRIALMVMDIAEKQKEPNAFMEIIRRKSFRERITLVINGLRAAPNTVAHRVARAELIRMVGPATLSIIVNVAAVLLLLFWVPYIMPPPGEGSVDGGVTINLSTPDPVVQNNPGSAAPDSTGDSGTVKEPPPTPSGPAVDTDSTLRPFMDQESQDSRELFNTPPTAGPERDETNGDPLNLHPRLTSLPPGLTAGPHSNRNPTNRATILTTQKAEKTHDAVLRALRWLKANQDSNGSWPGQEAAAMTGLSLLAYLAHGDLPASPEFGDTVTRGLRFLLSRQGQDGAFSKDVYAHAIATYAIAEAYSMTRIMELKVPLEQATHQIIKGQQSNGGFDYNYQKGPRFDLSVSGWQIQALKAAQIAHPEQERLPEALSRATHLLLTEALARDGSGFVYAGKAASPTLTGGSISMTGVGTLCLQLLGRNTAAQTRAGLKLLQSAKLNWPASGKANVYAGYYVSQAKFHGGNQTDWMRWNLNMQRVLLSRQHQDGHWDQGDYETGANVYTTTLCTLMLEVYYRYLPSYAHRPGSDPSAIPVSGDFPIDIH